jgi:hypothetical protein
MDGSRAFRAAYGRLERRMRALADAEGDVFLPGAEPEGPADYILIGMEPSLGRWAQNPVEARSKVDAGFRNFLSSFEDYILHFCIRRYLCAPRQRYHITDLSKGAMLVERTSYERADRYDRWFELLEDEMDLISRHETRFIAIGGVVAAYLARAAFSRPFTRIIHYSPQAANARRIAASHDRRGYKLFSESVSLDDIIDTASSVLTAANVPVDLHERTLSRLSRSRMSESRLESIFSYKVAFESMRC